MTVLVCSSKKLPNHNGETYDDIIVVDDQPSTETIHRQAQLVKDGLIKAWERAKAGCLNLDGPPVVDVKLDAAGPYFVMLENFQSLLRDDRGIVIQIRQG